MQNRSVPANVLLPHVVYEDVGEAIAWLARVFGFREHCRYGDPELPQGGSGTRSTNEVWLSGEVLSGG